MLIAGRWPTFFIHDTLNNDEAQAVAQAIAALHDPVPWRGFDGNTCGPLNTYILMVPAAFGAHITFFTARVTAVLLEWFDVLAVTSWCLDSWMGKTVAWIAPLPAVLFFAFSTHPEFIDYGGETLSVALSMAAIVMLPRLRRRPVYSLLIGLCVGALPLAKLQAVPLAMCLAVLALVMAWSTRRLLLFALGCAAVPAMVLGAALAGGSIHDFWESYIVTSVAYVSHSVQPLSYLTSTAGFGQMFCSLLAVACAGLVVATMRWRRVGRPAACAWLILVAALVTIYSPGRGSLNYLTFAVFPIALVAASGLSLIIGDLQSRWMRGTMVVAFAVMCVSVQPIPSSILSLSTENTDPTPIDALLARYVSPGDRLAIWGWRPQYYVDTQTVMGTRDSITRYQQTSVMNPEIDYFRARYLGDLEANRPKAFLDMGQESFGFPHEDWEELRDTVDREFCYVGAVGTARLYLRRDACA